jgi:hypothetical protein
MFHSTFAQKLKLSAPPAPIGLELTLPPEKVRAPSWANAAPALDLVAFSEPMVSTTVFPTTDAGVRGQRLVMK